MIILNLSNVWCCYIVVSSHKLPVNPMKCHEIPMKSYEIPRVSRFFPSKTSAWGLREGRGRPGGGLCPHSWQLCRGIRLGRCVVIVVIRGENHGKSLWKPSEARKIGAFLTKIQWSVIISPLSPQNHTKMTKNKVLDTSKPGNVGQLSDLNGWFYRWEKDIALWLMDCSSATFDYRRILGDIVGISWEHILFNTSQHFWCGTPVS